MAAARDVWSFSMSLLRWREGDYGLYGAMKPYITLLSPSVCVCVCEAPLTQSDSVSNHKTKSYTSAVVRAVTGSVKHSN